MAEKRSRSGLRLIRFEHDGSVKLGAELGDGGNVVDLHAADPTIPVEMRTFLEQGAEAIEKAKRRVRNARSRRGQACQTSDS